MQEIPKRHNRFARVHPSRDRREVPTLLVAIATTLISFLFLRPLFRKLFTVHTAVHAGEVGGFRRMRKRKRLYPEIEGRVVDYATHSYEDGWLHVTLYFKDGTNFSLHFAVNEPSIVPKLIEFGKYVEDQFLNPSTRSACPQYPQAQTRSATVHC